MQPPLNNFGYPGGYMQNAYPVSFPQGQPGMMPANVSMQPVATAHPGMASPAQPTSPEPALAPDAGATNIAYQESPPNFLPVTVPAPTVEQDDHHEEEH
eukprot:1421882-Rhodomonas_salina.1